MIDCEDANLCATDIVLAILSYHLLFLFILDAFLVIVEKLRLFYSIIMNC